MCPKVLNGEVGQHYSDKILPLPRVLTISELVGTIPDICHFFTLAKFLENKIYTEKRQFFALNL